MKKRLLALVCVLFLLPVGLTVPALSAEKTATPDIQWLDVAVEGTLHIIRYNARFNWVTLCWSSDTDGYQYIVIDLSSGEAAKCDYDYVGDFSEGLAVVGTFDYSLGDFLFGFIDTEGTEVVPPMYNDISDFSNGLAMVGQLEKPGDWESVKKGFINKQGAQVIPLKYSDTNDFSDGLALVHETGADGHEEWSFIDRQGKAAVSFASDPYAFSFSEGLARISRLDANDVWKCVFIDKQGNEVIPPVYDGAGSFSDGLAVGLKIHSDDMWKYGFIDKQGEIVIPFIYDNAHDFSDGLAAVAKAYYNGNQTWGFIDRQGERAVSFAYDDVGNFSHGLASVCKQDRWGFINKQGNVVVPLQYDSAGFTTSFDSTPIGWVRQGAKVGVFQNPYARVQQGGAPEDGLPDDPYSQPKRGSALDGLWRGLLYTLLAGAAAVIAVTILIAIFVFLREKRKQAAQETIPEPLSPAEPAAPAGPAVPEPTWTCPYCGRTLSPGANFCPSCSRSIKGDE